MQADKITILRELVCGVYKYVYNGQIIYIGSSAANGGILSRIRCHEKEAAFRPYLDGVEIYYMPLDSEVEARSVEALLINKYKPILCTASKSDKENTFDIELIYNDWKLFDKHLLQSRKARKSSRKNSGRKNNKADVKSYLPVADLKLIELRLLVIIMDEMFKTEDCEVFIDYRDERWSNPSRSRKERINSLHDREPVFESLYIKELKDGEYVFSDYPVFKYFEIEEDGVYCEIDPRSGAIANFQYIRKHPEEAIEIIKSKGTYDVILSLYLLKYLNNKKGPNTWEVPLSILQDYLGYTYKEFKMTKRYVLKPALETAKQFFEDLNVEYRTGRKRKTIAANFTYGECKLR